MIYIKKEEDVAVYKLLDLVCGMLELPVYAYAAATQTYALQNHAAGKKAAVRSYEKAGKCSVSRDFAV